MKTPVMMEIFKQNAEGRLSLNDSLPITTTFTSLADGSSYVLDRASDSETKLYDEVGKSRTILELTNLMITVSSNLATNLLIEKVEPDNIQSSLAELGICKLKVLRGVEDNKAFALGLNNVTCAADLLEILRGQEFNEIIPAKLPADCIVAHKTGSITGVQHDSGIVFLPDGRKYVIVLLSKNLKDTDAAIRMLSDVSRLIYDFVVSN